MAELRRCCETFAVTVDVDSFLGWGRTGRVWRVWRADAVKTSGQRTRSAGAPVALALKIAANASAALELQQEHAYYTKLR